MIWAMSVVLLSMAEVGEDAPAGKTTCVRVECRGKLRHGVLAIGGETTGTTLTLHGVSCELKLSDDAHRKLASEHHKRPVTVVGTLQQIRGTERKVRWIIHVEKLTSRDAAVTKEGADLTITGELKQAEMASDQPGRLTLDAGGATWEIDTSTEKELQEAAVKLIGKRAIVSGVWMRNDDSNPQRIRPKKIDPQLTMPK